MYGNEPWTPMDDYIEECNLYVDSKEHRIWEGRLFDEYVVVRPILPEYYMDIRQVPLEEFGRDYEDFTGNRAHIRYFLNKRFTREMYSEGMENESNAVTYTTGYENNDIDGPH